MTLSETRLLKSIRADLDALGSVTWTYSCPGGDFVLWSRNARNEAVEIARFHGLRAVHEVRFIIESPANVRFLLGLVDRAIAAGRLAGDGAPATDPRPSQGATGDAA